MKIILAHNFYGSAAPSGENKVFEAEKKLLIERGHDVKEFVRYSDEIRKQGTWGTVKGALGTPWNPFARRSLRKMLTQEKPDILHVHNFFPLLSPSILYAARNTNTATVLTLHNYRVFCAAAIPMLKGRTCTECLDKHSALPSIKYGCYRNSRLATLPLAVMIGLHRFLGTWQKHVDAFIALTEFQRNIMSRAGLPEEKIHIKPHFYADPPLPADWNERREKIVCIGRLSEEKGVSLLVATWKEWGAEAPLLEVIGDGPHRLLLESAVVENGLQDKIIVTGQLPFDETQSRLRSARMLILPSLCFEGFPMVIREAFALGVPVAASRLGAMESLVSHNETGVLFEPGNSLDILRFVKACWNDRKKLSEMGLSARKVFEEKYTAGRNYKVLMDIYVSAILNKMNRQL